MSKSSKYIFFALFFVFSSGLYNNSDKLTIKVDKRKIEVGETFTYSIEVSGNFSSPEITIPEFKDFSIVSRSQSKNFSLKGDQIHMDFSVTYSLFAPEPGVFIIDAPQIKDNDIILKAKPIKIKVTGKPLKEREKIVPFIESATDI